LLPLVELLRSRLSLTLANNHRYKRVSIPSNLQMRSHSPRVHWHMVAAATIAIAIEIEMAVVTVAVAVAAEFVVVAFVYPVQVDQWGLQMHNEVADLVHLDVL
jgi:hypothetical protein